MQSSQNTIQVDAFDTNLHGAKILCQGPFTNGKYPPIMESVRHLREPFKKTILLTNATFTLRKGFALHYDATFQMKDMGDWSLALTYILHSPKPCLVIADEIAIPDGFWPKLSRAITCIHISPTPIRNCTPYDAVFFAPIKEINTPYAEQVFFQIQSIFRSTYTQKEYREILQELRIADAGLAWTRYHETTPTGAIYWYDAVPTQGSDMLTKKQMSDILMWLAEQIN